METLPFLRRLSYGLQAVCVFLIYGLFRLLPLDAASWLGGAIMARVGMRLPSTRAARDNLAAAFPERTADDREAILRGMWENLGRVAGEYPHLKRLRARVEVEGFALLEAAAKAGKPAVFVGAHLANWEVNAIAAGQAGIDLALVYRRPNNPYVDGLLRHAREAGLGVAGHIVKGRSGVRDMYETLKSGGFVGILADQKLNEGIPVPFFGRPAMTAPSPAQLALKFKCPLYLARVERTKGARFRVSIERLEVAPSGDSEADTRRIMTEINSRIESWVRARPAQWLWIHRRWPTGA